MLPLINITTPGDLLGITDSAERLTHTGLIVYSTTENFCGIDFVYEGPNIWDGKKWEYLGEPVKQSADVHNFIDSRDNVTYRYREFGSPGTWMLDDMRAFV